MVPVLNEFRESKYLDKQCLQNHYPEILCIYSNIAAIAFNTFKQLLGKCLQSQCPSPTKTAVASLLFGRTNIQLTLKYPKSPLLVG